MTHFTLQLTPAQAAALLEIASQLFIQGTQKSAPAPKPAPQAPKPPVLVKKRIRKPNNLGQDKSLRARKKNAAILTDKPLHEIIGSETHPITI